MRVFLSVIVLAVLAYAIGFVLFVSNLPNTPARMPKADGIVALTGGGERLGRGRLAIPLIPGSRGFRGGGAQIQALFASYFSNTRHVLDTMFLPSGTRRF